MGLVKLAEYPEEEILPLLGETEPNSGQKGKRQFRLPNGDSWFVRIGTPRLMCLKRDQACVWCARAGNVFVLERSSEQGTPHLNLYHTSRHGNPQFLLMTQDHILPVSKGGTNDLENLQTMCTQCNQAKGSLTQLQFALKMTGWRAGEDKNASDSTREGS
jgi:5-methylcytosine-specific restriction endonuclease McrA